MFTRPWVQDPLSQKGLDGSTLVVASLLGQMDSGKSSKAKIIMNKAFELYPSRFTPENTNRIVSNSLNDAIDAFDDRPAQFLFIDDAYGEQSGRGSMAKDQRAAMKNFTLIRHKYDDRFSPPAYIVVFFTAQGLLDKMVRENLDVLILGNLSGIGSKYRSEMYDYLFNDRYMIDVMNKITSEISNGDIRWRSTGCYVTKASDIGFFDLRPWFFSHKNNPPWPPAIAPTDTNAILVRKYVEQLIDITREYRLNPDLPEFKMLKRNICKKYMYNWDSKLPKGIRSDIIDIYMGTMEEEELVGSVPNIQIKESIPDDQIVADSYLGGFKREERNGFLGRWVPLSYFDEFHGLGQVRSVIKKLMSIKIRKKNADGAEEILVVHETIFEHFKRSGGIQIFIPNEFLKVFLMDEKMR